MQLLSFSVSNFRSVKETQTIDFCTPEEQPLPVTAIYGANASGKSTLLEALNFASKAVRESATSWRSRGRDARQPHEPFMLDDDSRKQPSIFEFTFISNSTKYTYGFEYSYSGVHKEWLSYIPAKRWSPCFFRDASSDEQIEWNNSFITKPQRHELGKVIETELILSVALRNEVSPLQEAAQALSKGILALPFHRGHASLRIQALANLIRKGRLNVQEISQLLGAVDVGIEGVELDERALPPEVVELNKKIIDALKGVIDGEEQVEQHDAQSMTNWELDKVLRTLAFWHRGDGKSYRLDIDDESEGTLRWLSIAPFLVEAFTKGGVVLADELDASLHRSMMEMIVASFTDPTINRAGAQLILTTHNTNLLERMSEVELTPETFWFIRKNQRGATEFYPLADFQLQKGANYERRYLGGRYGALPNISTATIRGLVDQRMPELTRDQAQ